MGEAEEPPKNVLLDAGLLVFLATALSLCMSVLYVAGLSLGLRFPIQIYFGLQDYVQATPYWLGLVIGLAMFSQVPYVVAMAFFRTKEGYIQPKWFGWLWLLLGVGVVLAVLKEFDWPLAFFGALLTFFSFAAYLFAGPLAQAVSGKIIRLSILIGFPMAAFAFSLGFLWGPVLLGYEAWSAIYFSDAHSESKPIPLKGKILLALTQYLIVFRDDNVFVAVPVGRIERIETPKYQPVARPAQSPSATPASSNPTPAATPAPKVTASSAPAASASVSVSPKN